MRPTAPDQLVYRITVHQAPQWIFGREDLLGYVTYLLTPAKGDAKTVIAKVLKAGDRVVVSLHPKQSNAEVRAAIIGHAERLLRRRALTLRQEDMP